MDIVIDLGWPLTFLGISVAIYVWAVLAYELGLEDAGAPLLPPGSTWLRVGMWFLPRIFVAFVLGTTFVVSMRFLGF